MAAMMNPRQFTPGVEANNPRDLDGNPIGGGPWIRIDGLEIFSTPTGETMTVEQSTRHSGSYGTNHGLLQVADEKGRKYMAADTAATRKALEAGGYEGNGGWVEMSHGEYFTGQSAQAEFKRIRALSHDKEVQGMLRDRTVNVTGAYYDDSRPLKKAVKQVSHRPEHIGTYNISDTGLIAFVTAEGETRIGVQNPLRGHYLFGKEKNLEEYLQNHGYRKSETLEVPFAHGETPLKMQAPDRWGPDADKPAKPVPDIALERELEPYRNIREYKVAIRAQARETAQGREHASEFLKNYRGSRPVGAYAEFVRERQDTPGDGTPTR